jgi:hypothetical protein
MSEHSQEDRLVEEAPLDVAMRLDAHLDGDEPLVSVATDIGAGGRRYGRGWVAVARRRLVVLGDEGDTSVEVAQIRRVHTEPLVGGGRLEIELHDGPTVRVPYS